MSAGSYSDYSVWGIFSTRGKAKDFCDTFPNMDLNEIQGMVLDEFGDVVEACKDKKVFEVEMELVDGNVKRVREKTGELWASKMVLNRKFVMYNGMLDVFVFADSKEHAVKIVSEQRTRIIVEKG